MALKKLDIMKTEDWDNYDHVLIARDENDDLLAGYTYDSVKDVAAALHILGWFKGYDSKMLLDQTSYKSTAEIVEAIGKRHKTIFAKDGSYIQAIHIRGNMDEVK